LNAELLMVILFSAGF